MWEKDIKRLARDFGIEARRINLLIQRIEAKYGIITMPDYYNGNVSEYLYDCAQREFKRIICA